MSVAPARLAALLLPNARADLSSGLRFLFLGGQGGGQPLDVVSGAQPDTYANPSNQRWDGGKGLTWTSTTASAPFWNGKSRWESSLGWTVFAWFTCTGVGSSSGGLLDRELASEAFSTRIHQFRINASTGKIECIAFSGSNVYTANGGPNLTNDGQWHFAVGRYDGQTVSVWLDGVQVGSTAGTGAPNTGSAPITLGSAASNQTSLSNSETFRGTIAAAGLYNRPLTGPEIQRLYTEPGSLLQRVTPRRLYLAPSTVSASVTIPTTATSSASPAISVTSSATATLTTPGTTTTAPEPGIAPVQSAVTLTTAATTTSAPTPTVTPADQVGPDTTATTTAAPTPTVTANANVTLATAGTTGANTPIGVSTTATVSLTTAATTTATPTITVTPADQVGPDTCATTTAAPAPSIGVTATVSLVGAGSTTTAPTLTLPVTTVVLLTSAGTTTTSPAITPSSAVPNVKGYSRGGINRSARAIGTPTRVGAMRGTPVRAGSATGGVS